MPIKTYQDLTASEEQEITNDLEVKQLSYFIIAIVTVININ